MFWRTCSLTLYTGDWKVSFQIKVADKAKTHLKTCLYSPCLLLPSCSGLWVQLGRVVAGLCGTWRHFPSQAGSRHPTHPTPVNPIRAQPWQSRFGVFSRGSLYFLCRFQDPVSEGEAEV